MTLAELAALTAKDQEKEKEEPDEDLFEGDDDETMSNLTEALSQLEDCYELLLALDDPITNPRGRLTRYFKREITKMRVATGELLMQYDISG